MSLREMKLLLLMIVCSILISCISSQCSEAICSCVKPDGINYYDLSALKIAGPIVSEDGKFSFQACKNTNLNPKKGLVNSSDCESSSLCMKDENNNFVNIGTIEETRWSFPIGKDFPFLIIQHTYGDKLKSQIELHCCTDCKTKLEIIPSPTVPDKINHLKLSSSTVCLKDTKHDELSTGSLLVILLLIFSGLYFIGGAIALRCLRGAVGWELLPNYDFWFELPGLIRDGVTFTLSGCSENTYEQI